MKIIANYAQLYLGNSNRNRNSSYGELFINCYKSNYNLYWFNLKLVLLRFKTKLKISQMKSSDCINPLFL